MKFQRILEAVHFKPWLITPRAHASIRNLIETRLHESIRPRTERPTQDIFGNELPVMTIQNGIATIPICGVIGKNLGMLEKSCGAVSIEDISNDIQTALSDPSVKGIFLDIHSPGGTVGGIPELGSLIDMASRKKPIYAFTEGEMCSAAYWIGAAASRVIASPSSEVGSIGVYLPWVDQTAAYAMEGLKVDLIKNTGGTYKGMGFPGTSLTQEQRDQLQSGVDQVFAMFTKHNNDNRQNVSNEAFKGQTFMGEKAKEAGLIDLVGSRDDAMRLLWNRINP